MTKRSLLIAALIFASGCATDEVVRTTYVPLPVPMGDVTCEWQMSPQSHRMLYCTDHRTGEHITLIVPKGKQEV